MADYCNACGLGLGKHARRVEAARGKEMDEWFGGIIAAALHALHRVASAAPDAEMDGEGVGPAPTTEPA